MESDSRGTASGDDRSVENERAWTLPLTLIAAIAIAGVLLTIRQSAREPATENSEGWTPVDAAGVQTVSLSIDFGNGARREFAALRWSDGMTVADVMQQAREFRPGIVFTQQGEGEMALLMSLDGVANDAALSRFWIYDVDGKAGDVSFAVQRVAAGQRVHWTYSNKASD